MVVEQLEQKKGSGLSGVGSRESGSVWIGERVGSRGRDMDNRRYTVATRPIKTIELDLFKSEL